MASDDLETPLGLNDAGKSRRLSFTLPFKLPLKLPFKAPIGPPVVVALLLCLVVFAGWALMHDDPLGGEPTVVVSADPGSATAVRADAGGKPAVAEKGAARPGEPGAEPAPGNPAQPTKTATGPTVTIIDGSTGKREEVSLPSGDGQRLAAIDQRLLETTRHGPVPRVALDGTRPSVVYARPASPSKPSAPKIAIVIGGLGVSAAHTADAIKKLPAAVTLAFVPYAADLERTVARARGDGHEVLLQIPMEPFDYPENDPGPQTLLTSLAPDQNIDRMHWLMSRFQGYVGLANYMGARFTATEIALAPVLREVSKRGLVFVDDGSSPRSLASQIAGANNMPFAKTNVVIDAAPSQAEVERALTRLETIARDEGFAVGMANALPLSIDQIAKWAKSAEARGYVLVPITTVAIKAKAS